MTNLTNRLVVGGVLLALVLSAWGLLGGSEGQRGRDGEDGAAGAVATLDGVDSPYVRINGVEQYYYNQNFSATSSAVCSLLNPYGAATTSVLSYSVIASANGIATDENLYLSTSTEPSGELATSSPALMGPFSTGIGQFNMSWDAGTATTTEGDILGNGDFNNVNLFFLGPDEYLNLHIASGTPGTFTDYYLGGCQALLQRI